MVLVGAVWELGSGWYIYAKAEIGQWLIARAWELSLERQEPVKPWSWADTHPVGRLRVPGLGIDQYVLAGATGRTMAFGPGHHDESVYPGEPGDSVLLGHRDTHFAFLGKLEPGDGLQFQDETGTWHAFEVETAVIMNDQEEKLLLGGEKPRVFLVTCYPFHAIVPGGPLRYVVEAKERKSDRIKE